MVVAYGAGVFSEGEMNHPWMLEETRVIPWYIRWFVLPFLNGHIFFTDSTHYVCCKFWMRRMYVLSDGCVADD